MDNRVLLRVLYEEQQQKVARVLIMLLMSLQFFHSSIVLYHTEVNEIRNKKNFSVNYLSVKKKRDRLNKLLNRACTTVMISVACA